MKHLNPELERLEQRIAPGMLPTPTPQGLDISAELPSLSSIDIDVDFSS